jgi:autotransporter-associated beta strand protein
MKHILLSCRAVLSSAGFSRLPLSSYVHPVCTVLLGVLVLLPSHASAGESTWKLNPISNDWYDANNWTPERVPEGPSDTALFGASDSTSINLSMGVSISSIAFQPGASSYTITPAEGGIVYLTGTGIVNESGMTQDFVVGQESDAFLTEIWFKNSASAGNGTQFTNNGTIRFLNSSNAAGATIITIGEIVFQSTSSAANGRFVVFGENSGEGLGGFVSFEGSSTADHGAFTINGAPVSGSLNEGFVLFNNSSRAADAIVTCNGSMVAGTNGGGVFFYDNSNAENGTLIAQGGSDGGSGGFIRFADSSSGGTARVETFGDGNLDISDHVGLKLTIGSLEGDGFVFLGSKSLSIGGNNLTTTFSGIIQDGGVNGGAAGALTKVGAGTLTLSGVNTYTGGTTLNAGSLVISNKSGSGTGAGAVSVSAGTLAGQGTIAGAVTMGTGSGAGAILAPAAGTNKPATLTIQSALTIKSDSTYTYTLKARKRKSQSDQVIAKGVTIESGAQFNFLGQVVGKLRQGTSFSVISNTAATPISGVFADLADGAILSVNGNNLQASYEGGDGNDLTLTVTP